MRVALRLRVRESFLDNLAKTLSGRTGLALVAVRCNLPAADFGSEGNDNNFLLIAQEVGGYKEALKLLEKLELAFGHYVGGSCQRAIQLEADGPLMTEAEYIVHLEKKADVLEAEVHRLRNELRGTTISDDDIPF